MKPVLQAKEFEGYFWIPAHIHVEEVTKAYEAGAAAEREACADIAFNAKTYLEAAAAVREWVGLTNAEVNMFSAGCNNGNSVQDSIRKAEAKLKEKNGV